MKRVFLTGATGPLGAALADYLTGQGMTVTATVHPGSKRQPAVRTDGKIDFIECDLSELRQLTAKLTGRYDAFFHLAWETATREIIADPLVQARNIQYTLDAAGLAADLGCQVFVGAGSQAEYGRVAGLLGAETPVNPETSYGLAKYAAGQQSRKLCEAAGLRHCWGRVLSLYGPFDRETTAVMYVINSLLKGEKPVLTRAEQLWDYLYSADGARAFYLIAENGRHGAAYPVGSGQARPLREYFEIIRDNIDPKLPLGIGEAAYPNGVITSLRSDISVLTKETGFVPEYLFEAGIKATIAWAKLNQQ